MSASTPRPQPVSTTAPTTTASPAGAERILAIDVGTQSTRAVVFDPLGRIVAAARVPYAPYVSPQPGWAEQDPEIYWQAIAGACRRLWAEGLDPASLGGLAVTTQRGTVVCTDERGDPVRPAIVWLDVRRAEDTPRIGGIMGLAFRALRASETVARFQADAEVNWLRRHEPETMRRTRHYLLLSGFLIHRLTDRFADSVASQVAYIPFDYRRLAWAGRRDWKWRAVPIERALLPDLVPPTGRLGEVSAAAADVTGLPVGLPVVAAGADRACEALGAGALDPATACIGYGTTASVSTIQARYLEAVPLVPPYPAALPGAYSLEFQIFRGYWLVEWFRRELGQPETQAAATAGSPPAEALLDRLLDEAPAGSMGLLHLPYWAPGIRFPGPEAKGAFVGLGDVHGRAHLYRATLEGLAFGLRDGLERAERRAKVPVTSIRLAGGGSRGRGIAQLTADVFGRPVALPHTHETAALGAAIDAAVGLGLHPDVPAAAQAMTHIDRVHEPDPATHALYDELYRKAFLGLYDALRPTYRAIREVTGYPK
ncbi:MAG TPA: FGGY-family carbohydrate kinase [Candidatus Limnocylindrales bacterium]